MKKMQSKFEKVKFEFNEHGDYLTDCIVVTTINT